MIIRIGITLGSVGNAYSACSSSHNQRQIVEKGLPHNAGTPKP